MPTSTASSKARDQILRLIEAQDLKPGDRLPAEDSLSRAFGFSRPTVREALRQLEREQVIYCVHGRGRFVSTDLQRYRDAITRLRSVTEMSQALGFTLTTSVLGLQTRLPSDEERGHLHLETSERVVELIRARLAETDPLIYSVDVFPETVVKGLPDPAVWAGSLVRLFESWGVTLAYAETSIHATLLPPAVARHLGVVRTLPWILLIQVNYDTERRPRLFSHDYHRGDKFSFRVTRHRFALGEEDCL
ncbi:MAG: GntR family transcriptional regulator [Armatimonadota bacterium]|nr:GntR family transcriptional regulator [Armatimonadota bacterium]